MRTTIAAVTTAVIVLLLAVGAASAQPPNRSMPPTPLRGAGQIVDARGVLIGDIVGFGGQIAVDDDLPTFRAIDPGWPMVSFTVNGTSFALLVTSRGFITMTPLLYTTSECQGRPYIVGFGGDLFASVAVLAVVGKRGHPRPRA